MAQQRRRVFITVAEVSGDRHAAQLIRALRALDPALLIEGHGGPEMAAAGAVLHRETVANAAMGLRGALRAVEVSRLLRWTGEHFDRHRPDLYVGVDSPSMNFHFAKLARARGIPVLQYVAPQLWAWREGRMRKLRRRVDRLACILPFEEPYFRRHGVNATFVGHPLFDQLPPDRGPAPEQKFPHRPPVVGLLPGSRRSEAQANFARMMDVAGRVREAFPDVTFLVPTTGATQPVVEAEVKARGWAAALAREAPSNGAATDPPPPRSFIYGLEQFDEMVPRCDLCLTVSGTATLHVAGFGVPMIVVYGASPLVWNLLGRWVIPTRTFALVNVLAAGPRADPTQHIVPEFVPWYGAVDAVAGLATDYLRHPDKLLAQRRKLLDLVAPLDRPGASENVARLVLEMLGRQGETSAGAVETAGSARPA